MRMMMPVTIIDEGGESVCRRAMPTTGSMLYLCARCAGIRMQRVLMVVLRARATLLRALHSLLAVHRQPLKLPEI